MAKVLSFPHGEELSISDVDNLDSIEEQQTKKYADALADDMIIQLVASLQQEGLNIGNGSIDFSEIIPLLSNNTYTWIVETWQGHLNQGRGFASSLEELSDLITSRRKE